MSDSLHIDCNSRRVRLSDVNITNNEQIYFDTAVVICLLSGLWYSSRESRIATVWRSETKSCHSQGADTKPTVTVAGRSHFGAWQRERAFGAAGIGCCHRRAHIPGGGTSFEHGGDGRLDCGVGEWTKNRRRHARRFDGRPWGILCSPSCRINQQVSPGQTNGRLLIKLWNPIYFYTVPRLLKSFLLATYPGLTIYPLIPILDCVEIP